MRISIIGMPGAGKSTLARKLAGLGLHYISSGDLARASGFAGSKAESSGKLDPDENKIIKLVREAVKGKDSYVLDGFPRQSGQATKVPIDLVIFLDVAESIARKRLLKRGRPDDRVSVINNRMDAYKEFTHPLVAFYCSESPCRIVSVCANYEADQVFTEAMMEIIKYAA